MLVPPNYLLFPGGETVICMDSTSFRELFRLSSNGAQIARNGLAYDALSGTLYVLWADSRETVLLGRLDLFAEEGERQVEVHAPFERYNWRTRDFQILSVYSHNPDAPETEIGIRYAVEEHYIAKPFYLDDHTVVVNTPGGALIGVDTIRGTSEVLEDAWSPIQDLCMHAPRRLLLVGTKWRASVPIAENLYGFDSSPAIG